MELCMRGRHFKGRIMVMGGADKYRGDEKINIHEKTDTWK